MSTVGELVWIGKTPHKITALETIFNDGQPFYVALSVEPLREEERLDHGLAPTYPDADRSPAL